MTSLYSSDIEHTHLLFGKIFADRGYVSQPLANKLLHNFGIQFFAKPRRNLKNRLMQMGDKLLARKRSIIETVIDQLKNISQIEHSRHRSRREANPLGLSILELILCVA